MAMDAGGSVPEYTRVKGHIKFNLMNWSDSYKFVDFLHCVCFLLIDISLSSPELTCLRYNINITSKSPTTLSNLHLINLRKRSYHLIMPLLLPPPSPSIASNKLRLSTLTFVTSNADKIREVTSICKGYGITVNIRSIDLPELQGSIEEVAREKCRQAALAVNGPVLIEDSAVIFHALNGLPGPYIKWFYHSLGLSGLNRILAGHEDKSAAAVCTFAFSWGPRTAHEGSDSDSDSGNDTSSNSSEPEVFLFQGRNEGQIVPERGEYGFAYDFIFEYEGKTYSELKPEVKNQVSDRSKALTKFIDWLAS